MSNAASRVMWVGRTTVFFVVLALVVLGYAAKAYAAPGDLDTSFGSGGKVTTDFAAGLDQGNGVAVQDDGKVVVAGRADNGPTGYDFALARYNPSGTLDTTFGTGGKVITPIGSGADVAYGVAVQGTKIVAVGYSYQGTSDDFAVVRYSSNGAPDSTFSGDGKLTTAFSSGSGDRARSVAIQPDGKIVAAGFVIVNSANTDFALARYDSSGNPDNSFGSGGKTTTDFGGGHDGANSVAIQDDGRIVAAGNSGVDAPTQDLAVARYNADGTPNNTFSNDGRVTTDFGGYDEANGAALQTDGHIVVAGHAGNSFGFNGDFALARYFAGSDDVTPPKVSRPAHTLDSATTLGTSTTSPSVPTRITWSATDAHGDVARYQLQRSTDGGAYTNVSVGVPTSTTTTITEILPPYKNNYRYRVRATDDNGNTSFYKYGPRFTVEDHQETSTSVAYSPSAAWTQEFLSDSYGGQVMYATATGSTSELTFTGTNVAWVAPKTSNRGKAEVYLDGVKVQTVDLYSSTTLSRQVVYSANGLDPTATHKLKIKALGTKNASSSGTRVDVDAFVVLR